MKTLIALDDQEELIDKFEAAADGINADMALAEKALKVELSARRGAARLMTVAVLAHFRLFLLHHLLQSLRGLLLPSYPSFCTFHSIFDILINIRILIIV